MDATEHRELIAFALVGLVAAAFWLGEWAMKRMSGE